jgi:nitrogen fixation NifU-like protein
VINVDDELIEHMSSPNNYGRIDDADSIGIGENPQNGEKVIIYLNVSKKDDDFFIDDIKFEAIACMTTVVAGSIITKEAKEISFLTAEELVAVTLGMLEQVPPEQAACSEMVAVALKAAMDGFKLSLEKGEKKTLIYKIEQSCSPEKEFNATQEEQK